MRYPRTVAALLAFGALPFLTSAVNSQAQIPDPARSPFADKPANSYSNFTDEDGKPGVLIWGQAPFKDFGSRTIDFTPLTNLRQVNQIPEPGVHPRICFTPADLPDIRRRLKETKCGQGAWKNILSWTKMMKGDYDDKADYAQPDVWNGSFGGLHGRVPLFRLGVAGKGYNHNETAARDYASLVDGTATDFPEFYWNTMSLEAFRCLIENDETGAKNVAKAVITALKIDQAKRDVKLKAKPSPYPPEQPIGAFQLAFCYDFLFNWLTPDQKQTLHDELAFSTWSHDNYGTFNTAEASRSNWATFSYWLFEALAIEEEPGFNDLKVRGMYRGWRDLLTYGWFKSGATFEGEAKNQLGMDGILMFTMRQKAYGFENLCQHPYLLAYADEFLPESLNPMLTGFHKYDLLGGSRAGSGGFTPCDFLGLKYMMPGDKRVDYIFHKAMGDNYEGVPDRPDGYYNGLLFCAIFASDFDPANNDPGKLGLSNTFFCGERALMMTRSSWDTDAMMLNMHTRQCNGGHPFADRNSIMVAGAGRIWSPNGYANFKTAENSVVSIDDQDKRTQEVNVPGRMVDFQDNPQATFAVGDASYCWDWKWKVLNKKKGYYTADDVKAGKVEIDPGYEQEKHTVNDFAYTKLDYAYLNVPLFFSPNWILPSGAISPIVRTANYPVKRAFRTAGMVRGNHPYALVLDDIQKDDVAHHYVWNLGLEYDIQIVSAKTNAPGQMDIILTGLDPDQKSKRGKEPLSSEFSGPVPDKQPMLLVRVLNVSPGSLTTAPQIVELPNMTGSKYATIRKLVIPCDAITPDYKVLLFPYHNGDALPTTTWDTNHTSVQISWQDQQDQAQFTPGTCGLTHLSISRHGTSLINLVKEVQPISD